MPALNAYSPPLDVGSRGRLGLRRVWAFPELRSHSLLVLTLGELYLAPRTGEPREEVIAAAEGVGDLDELFGPLATVIELAAVKRARLDLLTNTLILDLVRGGHSSSRVAVRFATPESADACFSRIWRRLGSDTRLLSQRPDWRPLARTPLIALTAVLTITAALALASSAAEDLPPAAAASVAVPGEEHLGGPVIVPTPVQRLFGWLDWRVICSLGGIAAAATQVWLYRRLTQPPVSLEVIRD